jgi:fanconi-associated nuclease 1
MRNLASKGGYRETMTARRMTSFECRVHSEGRIVAFLFSLLFWDILFAAVPGAFETPYQTAPLDLWEDTFYFSRVEAIKTRIKELEEGGGAEILRKVDERERAKNTWCVGVKWEAFSQTDLLEIVEVCRAHILFEIISVRS